MVNTSRLMALLNVDDQGEQIAGLLNRALVDERKRRLLITRLREIEEQLNLLEQDILLSPSEREVMEIIQGAMKPTSTAEVQELSEGKSLRDHRQKASATLNGLVVKGLLGKMSLGGREVYFAPARDAVRHALTQLGQTPTDADPSQVASITGLHLKVVIEVIEGM